MKLKLDESSSPATPESAALAAWYDAHAVVRRMWAVDDGHTLRVP